MHDKVNTFKKLILTFESYRVTSRSGVSKLELTVSRAVINIYDLLMFEKYTSNI